MADVLRPGWALLRANGVPLVQVALDAVNNIVPYSVNDVPVWSWGEDQATSTQLMTMYNERNYPTPPGP